MGLFLQYAPCRVDIPENAPLSPCSMQAIVRVETISANPTPIAVASGMTMLTTMLIHPIDIPLKNTLLAVLMSPAHLELSVIHLTHHTQP
jgi:hypothetical protein